MSRERAAEIRRREGTPLKVTELGPRRYQRLAREVDAELQSIAADFGEDVVIEVELKVLEPGSPVEPE